MLMESIWTLQRGPVVSKEVHIGSIELDDQSKSGAKLNKNSKTIEKRKVDFEGAAERRRSHDRLVLGERYDSQKLNDAAGALEVLMYLVYLAKHDDQANLSKYMILAEGRLHLLYEIAGDMARLYEKSERSGSRI